jgi:hypothetical protein
MGVPPSDAGSDPPMGDGQSFGFVMSPEQGILCLKHKSHVRNVDKSSKKL